MTTPQARRARAERLAQEYFMQWGVIDTLPSLRDEDEELASRWLTDLLLTFAAQEAELLKENDHGTRPGVAGSDRVVATGPSFSAAILAHTQARSCLLTVHGDSKPCGTCAVCLLVGAEAALAGKEAEFCEWQALLDRRAQVYQQEIDGLYDSTERLRNLAIQKAEECDDLRARLAAAEGERDRILTEVNLTNVRLGERVRALEGALGKLRNEVSEIAIEVIREQCGNTNAAVLRLRVDEADALLTPPPAEEGWK